MLRISANVTSKLLEMLSPLEWRHRTAQKRKTKTVRQEGRDASVYVASEAGSETDIITYVL